jgi:5'-3' exonuclease
MARACLIDASIYIFRAYFSLPDNWRSPGGRPLNAVYGYTRFLLDLVDAGDLGHCAAAFDESLGSCFRNEIYPAYKSRRELPDEALAFQLASCRRVTELLGIACYGGPRYEADDYLATLAARCQQRKIPVTVVTRDKDLGQLLARPGDLWWDYAADLTLDAAAFQARHGVPPDRFADYLALTGDPIDDIPGVPGVGPKSAAVLVNAFSSLEALGAGLDKVGELPLRGAARIAVSLDENWEQVLLARRLTGLAREVPGVTLPGRHVPGRDHLVGLADFLRALGLDGPLVARCERIGSAL